jgi:hypothetical protein
VLLALSEKKRENQKNSSYLCRVVHLLLGYLKEPAAAAAKKLASSPRISLFQKNKIKRSFDGWKNFCHFISLCAPPSSSTVSEFFSFGGVKDVSATRLFFLPSTKSESVPVCDMMKNRSAQRE